MNLDASREITCRCGETLMIERRVAAAGDFYPAQKNRRRR
jgi:hypothetical protein